MNQERPCAGWNAALTGSVSGQAPGSVEAVSARGLGKRHEWYRVGAFHHQLRVSDAEHTIKRCRYPA